MDVMIVPLPVSVEDFVKSLRGKIDGQIEIITMN